MSAPPTLRRALVVGVIVILSVVWVAYRTIEQAHASNQWIVHTHAMQGRGTIRVSIASEADTCQVAVADEGPGIPAESLAKIFVPFFTTKSRGSGLGLPTAKRIIEAHRGRITITCPVSRRYDRHRPTSWRRCSHGDVSARAPLPS